MGGLVGEITGANKRAANAAGNAANAKEASARKFQKGTQGRVDDLFASANDPQALAAIEKSIGAQERQLVRQESLMESINPALKEAANQALRLLKGEESAALGPIKKQRAQQRQQLLNQLREQLGPGAETSSAGMQALNQFDSESNNLLGQQQQSTLGGLLGTAQNSQQNIGAGASNLGSLSSLGFNRQQSAFTSGQGALQGAQDAVTNSSGSQFVRSGLRAAQQQQMGSEAFQAGSAALGGGLLGGLTGGGDSTTSVQGRTNGTGSTLLSGN